MSYIHHFKYSSLTGESDLNELTKKLLDDKYYDNIVILSICTVMFFKYYFIGPSLSPAFRRNYVVINSLNHKELGGSLIKLAKENYLAFTGRPYNSFYFLSLTVNLCGLGDIVDSFPVAYLI